MVKTTKKHESPKSQSPKKGEAKAAQKAEVNQQEEIIVLALPTGVMHDKCRQIYDANLVSDVSFIVGSSTTDVKTFKLHKCMLVSESPMFQKLICDLHDYETQLTKSDISESWEKIKVAHAQPPAIDPFMNNTDEINECGSPKLEDLPKRSDKNGKKGSPRKKGSPGKKEIPKKSKTPTSSPNKTSPKSKKEKGSPKKSPIKDEKKIGATEKIINILIDVIAEKDTVKVHDVHPDGFYRLIRYIYYDEIVFNGVIGTIRTLYAARKYMFYELSKACVIYLENNVTLKHVLRLLKASFDFHEDKLQELCMDMLRNHTFEVISQNAFIFISKQMLQLVLEQDVLNIREIELFDRVCAWAANRCELIHIPVTAQNQRIAMGPYTMSLIRFPTILPHEFAIHIVENGILTNEEIIGIMSYHITGIKPVIPYSFVTRRRPYKIPEPDYEALSIVYSDTTDITFVDTMREKRLRYAISMDNLEEELHGLWHPIDQCIQTQKPQIAISDYPIIINKALYRTTSLPSLLNAEKYDLQLIHHKLHRSNCRTLNQEYSYIGHEFKDLTVLKPVFEQKPRLRHWDFENQLKYNSILRP